MSASNQSLIHKADLVVADMVSGGGYLVPEQANKFFEILIKESRLLQTITTKQMSGDRYEEDKAAFLGQVLVPASEGEVVSEEDRSKPDLGKMTLQTKEYIAEVHLTYNDLEDNIEGAALENKIRQLLGKAISRDLEDLVISGDTALANTSKRNRLLRQMDGILKQATTHVVAAGGVRFGKTTLEQMYRSIPAEFYQPEMSVITSKNAAFDYASTVANRQTALGDQTLTQRMKVADFMGHPVIPIPLFPENLGGGTDQTNALLLNLKNIHLGIQRQIRIETDKDIRARKLIVVATLRCDMKYMHEPAVVKATGITASA